MDTSSGRGSLELPMKEVPGVLEAAQASFARRGPTATLLYALARWCALHRLSRWSLFPYMAGIVCAQAAIWLGTPHRSWAGEATHAEALSLLRNCLKTQSRTDRLSMRVVTDRDFGNSPRGAGWPRDERVRTFLRRDGDRLDVTWWHLFRVSSTVSKSVRSRAVITKDVSVRYSVLASSLKPSGTGIVSNKDWATWFAAMGVSESCGGPLDGYFPPSGTLRIAELMAEAPSLGLRGSEAVEGTPCKVVEARTRYGTYAMWVAESKGFLPLKLAYEIGPDDLVGYTDDRPLSEVTIRTPDGHKHVGSRASGVLDKVVVARIDNAFVPIAGTFTRTDWYGDVHFFAANSYKRTEIKLPARFEGTDAFVTDLPEGARVTNLDDQTSGVEYEWRGGKAVPAGTAYGGSPAVPSWESRPTASQLFWATLGLVLFGTGISMARPMREG